VPGLTAKEYVVRRSAAAHDCKRIALRTMLDHKISA